LGVAVSTYVNNPRNQDVRAWHPARLNYFTAFTDSIFSKVKGASTVA
jgi:hypothetical protein